LALNSRIRIIDNNNTAMKYLIWYDATAGEYNWGTQAAYKEAFRNSADDAILAEEFVNTSENIVRKITLKLNKNLTLVK